jgi:hypothetical protein
MNRRIRLTSALPLAALLAAPAALPAYDHESSWQVRESKTLSETFVLESGSAGCHLLVDNLEGSITVSAGADRRIVMRAEETVRARSADDAALARREVRLDIDRRGGAVELYVDGPFRCGDRDSGRWCDSGRRRYVVGYDFTLEVPARCDLELSTVNRGRVTVRGVAGTFDIQSVNGPIELERIGGSGFAHTVNGGVRASFATLPSGGLDFETVNGDVDTAFVDGLAGDFLLRSFSGEMWSEFAYTALPPAPGEGRREDGRFVYRQSDGSAIRVGGGGPKSRFVTLNGDVTIRRAGQ